MGLPLISTGKTRQIHTSPPSEMETIWEMGFLKRHEEAGPDGLSPFFNYSGKVLIAKLSKLLRSIRVRGQVPEAYC